MTEVRVYPPRYRHQKKSTELLSPAPEAKLFPRQLIIKQADITYTKLTKTMQVKQADITYTKLTKTMQVKQADITYTKLSKTIEIAPA